ncbi:intraflagellar transport protein 56 isoform X2 [Ischnura elegans]|nr:intraflagellar transport protein 56 isoform X2 [Ischnura elegans]
MLSRAKPAAGHSAKKEPVNVTKQLPKLNEFLKSRDYVGALTLLEFSRNALKSTDDVDMWIGYCAFHLGDYKKALFTYEKLLQNYPFEEIAINLSCCYFFLGMYKEALEAAEKAPEGGLKSRLLLHLSHRFADDKRVFEMEQKLGEMIENRLSLASLNFIKAHYQESLDVYKAVLLDHREYLAIKVYEAYCYYKNGYLDKSQEALHNYLQHYPDSVTANNLKACIYYHLDDMKAAETELKILKEQTSASVICYKDLIDHNKVVFQRGEGALQILSPLVGIVPEARLNLVIYHILQDDISEAYNLMKDIKATQHSEYILKGIIHTIIGQKNGSREDTEIAQQYYLAVGNSESERDTVQGRECMASFFFLLHQFDEVNRYLNAIRSHHHGDDVFNFNYGQAKAAIGSFKEAEEAFQLVQSEKLRCDYTFISLLGRCYIMNKKPQDAWELYLKMEASPESFNLLQLIANDCYKMGHFYHAAKAFDMLERFDPNPEYWEGKRGACIGMFQKVIACEEPKSILKDAIQLLKTSNKPGVEQMIKVIKTWAKENKINVFI